MYKRMLGKIHPLFRHAFYYLTDVFGPPWSIETCLQTNDSLSSKISLLYQSTTSRMYFSMQAVEQFRVTEAVLYYP